MLASTVVTHRLLLDAFLPYRLAVTSGLVGETIADAYRTQFDIGMLEWRVLAHVAERAGTTQQEIGARSRMDKVAVSRATIALAARGLVARRANPLDRRSQLLELTPAGAALHAAIAPRALAIERAIFGGFTEAELIRFYAMLRRIDEATLAAAPRLSDGVDETVPGMVAPAPAPAARRA